MNSQRTLNTIKNLSIGSAMQVITLLLSFVSRTVFINTLGNEYLSVNGLFTDVLSILSFTDLGIGTAIIFSLYRPLALGNRPQIGKLMNLFDRAYRIIALTIFVLGLCVIPLLPYIISDVPNVKENITFLYVLFLINTVCTYIFGYKRSLLFADQKNYIVVSLHTGFHVFLICLQIVILYVTHNFVLYLLAVTFTTLLENILTTIYVNRKYRWLAEYKDLHLNRAERKPIFQNVKNIVIYKLGSVILNSSSSIIISGLIRTTLVGLYSNYSLIINAVITIINQGVAGICASIGNYSVTASRSDNEKIFKQLCIMSFWGIGTISILLAFVLSPFIYIWIGEKFVLPDLAVIVIVLGFYVFMINSIPSSYRTAMGLFKEARFAPLFASIINVVLGVIGAIYWGLIGVFMATVIARLFTYCIIDPYFIYKKGFEKSPKTYFISFVNWIGVLIASYLLCFFITRQIEASSIIGLLTKGVIAIVVFNLIFIARYARSEELRMVLRRFTTSRKMNV